LIKAAALLINVVQGTVTAFGVDSVLALSVVQQSTWKEGRSEKLRFAGLTNNSRKDG